MSKVSLALCFGIPGSGKSTFLKNLLKHQETVHNFSSSYQMEKIVCLHFDEIIPISEQRNMIETEGAWKECRLSVIKAFELFLCNKLNIPIKSNFSPSDITLLERIGQGILNISGQERCIVFIIEDNFYYQSMRYHWYQLARQYSMGFCQIYIECSEDIAIKRNRSRENKVPEEIIKTIAQKMEKPDTENNSWEKFTFILEENWNDLSILKVLDLLQLSLKNPALPLEHNEDSKELSRLETSASILHQIDHILRKIVGSKIVQCQGTSGIDVKSVSNELNQARKNILFKLKNGEIIVPPDILEALQHSKDKKCANLDRVKIYLETHFNAEFTNLKGTTS